MPLRSILRSERRYLVASLFVSWLIGRSRKLRSHEPKDILIIKLDEIGDMVLSTHVFSLLKRDYPNASITVLCKPVVAELIEQHIHVDHVLTSVADWKKHYDAIIDLRGSWQTLRKTLSMRPAVRLDQASIRWHNKRQGRIIHEATTHFNVVAPLLHDTSWIAPRLYTTASDRDVIDKFMMRHELNGYAILAPGARSPLRRWPQERFATIALWLASEYNLKCICIGGPEDRTTIDAIVASSHGAAIAAPLEWSLSTYTALCEKAALFIGNESGPMHIASTFDIPLVGIYGPGIPKRFDVLGLKSQIVHHVLECNPCDQVHCIHPANSCMMRANVDEVKLAVRRAVGR